MSFTSTSPSRTNFHKAKLLFIEDNTTGWELIQKAMQRCLPEVAPIRAASPTQVLDLLTDWENQDWELPKLISLNLDLPTNEDGFRLLEQLKEAPEVIRQIPVVMLSPSATGSDVMRAYKLGVSVYMEKPIELKQWVSHLQTLRHYWWETVTLPFPHY